ncbi:hypothetical protein M433DRAFT_136725 [Acidomyces richmondensis BFW]|nr:hypothetical protein M433DRAFT_136725 [Acidomyces richmondensis BFW]
MADVPIVDIGPYSHPDSSPTTKRHVIDEVRKACAEFGFIQIKGHGVPVGVQQRILDSCKALFDLTQDQKDALSLKNNHVVGLGRTLLEILAQGLGHDVLVLGNFTTEPVVNLKILHYPPHNSNDRKQFGAGANADFGTLIILVQQPGRHGLQLYRGNQWLNVPALEDVFVVKMGDLIDKWTNGSYKNTLHRVINVSGKDRYSVPCFYQGDFTYKYPFNPRDEDEETVEMHIRRKFDQSYGI